MDSGAICVLVVVGVVALWIYSKNDRANNSFRVKCGECSHTTAWQTESQAGTAIASHYEQRHPEVPPGGVIEYRGQ